MTWKKILLGSAIFIVSIIFMVFMNKTLNPNNLPKCEYNYNSYDNYYYDDSDVYRSTVYDNCLSSREASEREYENKSFLIITVMGLIAIVAGVLVRSVVPISWGLGLAGLTMILYIFTVGFDAIEKPYRAILSCVALIVLLWLSYAKLGDKQKINDEGGARKPLEATDKPDTTLSSAK